jgi:cytochrome c551/c552
MKTILTLAGLFIFILGNANEGQDLFKVTCVACHTIGKGKLVGPDLVNVTEKRSQEWLVAFIKSSSTMIKSGDADAKAIFEEYKGILMPDNLYSDAQILSILAYIEQGGSGDGEQVVAVDILSEVTSINIESGAFLFSGEKRLANGGAACNSCHSVKDERIFSGGTLAKDLTESWDNMGSSGVAAIIRSSPFPVMNMPFSVRSKYIQHLCFSCCHRFT